MNKKDINFNYKRLHPFKWFILENYPFLEDSIDVLTNYQLFCKLGEMYNKEIDAINVLGVQVEYLTDWFDDLDVQEEINNKLDEMAESGELADIISQYLNSTAIFGYDSIESMKSAPNLTDGSYAKTIGYYSPNDGGGAQYKIRKITNDDVVDNMFIIALDDSENELIAEMICNDEVNIKSVGAKGDGVTDDSNIIYHTINYAEDHNLDVYLPDGTYILNSTNSEGTDAGVYIDSAISLRGNGENTIIKSGNNKKGLLHLIYIKNANNVQIKELTIDGGIDELDPSYPDSTYCHGIRVATSQNVTMDNLYIKNVSGYGIGLEEGSSQDIKFTNLYIKNTGRDGIDTKNFNSTNENFLFDNLTFESIGLNESAQSEGLTALDIRCQSAIVSNIYVKNLTANNSGVRFHNTNSTQGTGGKYGTATNIQVYGTTSTGEGIAINETGVKVSNAYIVGMGIGVRVTTEKNELVNVTADTCSLSGFRIDQTGNIITNCTSQNMSGNTNGAFDLRDGEQQLIGCKIINATTGLSIFSACHVKAIGCSFLGTITTPINRMTNCDIMGCYGITSYTNQLQVLNGLTGTGIDLPTTDSFTTFYGTQANTTIALVKGSSSSVSDAPTTNTVWNVLSIKNSTNYGSQFAFSNSGLFFRGVAAGTWDNWARIS